MKDLTYSLAEADFAELEKRYLAQLSDRVPLIGDEGRAPTLFRVTPGAATVLSSLLRREADRSSTESYRYMLREWANVLDNGRPE